MNDLQLMVIKVLYTYMFV